MPNASAQLKDRLQGWDSSHKTASKKGAFRGDREGGGYCTNEHLRTERF